MTMSERIRQLQEEIEQLREENARLKSEASKPEVPTPPAEDKEKEDLKKRVHFLEFQLNRVIKDKSALMKKCESIRKAKLPKFLLIDPDKDLKRDFNVVSERCNRLLVENGILYENNDALEKRNAELESNYKYAEEVVELYSSENEQLKAEIESLKQQIQQLRGKLISRDITINSYKDRERKPIIFEGVESDFYPGEQKDMIRELIEQRMENLDKSTRQYAVMKSLLDANQETGNRKQIKKKLTEIFRDFKGYSSLSKSQKDELTNLGFSVEVTGNHAKITFGDNRFVSVMSITASDNRSGLNTVSDIARVCL